MLRTRLTALAALGAIFLTVTACGGSSGNSSQPAPAGSSVTSAPSASDSSTASTASTANASDSSSSETPTFVNGGAALADDGNLVYVLEAVNPRIGTDKGDLIAKSRAFCTQVNSGESESQLEADAAKAFTNGSWVPSESEAQAIVGTVKAYGGC